ncbi:hypothetical protein FOZ61_006757 [Perkinsus olseni]|uniref:Uncharacterized protein n=1 Tax=Perkinsus olseni TaxID=32597 RepID=A0A7J6LPP4_PEROL|nr:hypothetical protein FOZ61_006757 [Perkinsus olseni]KAF4661096.1 hypothetical protein FOL46_005860 [Perkinsus olseni]
MREHYIGLILIGQLHLRAKGHSPRQKGQLRTQREPERSCVLSTTDFQGKGQFSRNLGNLEVECSPDWASVAAKYDEETKQYFLDYVSIELTPGELQYEAVEHYVMGDSGSCDESISTGAERFLEEGFLRNKFRTDMDANFNNNRSTYSPLVIARTVQDLSTFEMMFAPYQAQAVDNGNTQTGEHPISLLTVLWNSGHDFAFVSMITFVDPKSKANVRIPLSSEGLEIVRTAWKDVSHGRGKDFEQKFISMLIDVGKKLLENPGIKANAESWGLMQEREPGKAAFTVTLIVAVATNWNEDVKDYIPHQP